MAGAAPVAVVARICWALDGLPLAIELAAARAGVLSAEEIQARLADEALAQIPATSFDPLLGEVLAAKAEVLRLAGTPGDAETSLRRAQQLYEDRRMTPLAERARALLASLAEQHPPR